MAGITVLFFLLIPALAGQDPPKQLPEITVVGEVIDSKCYLTQESELSRGEKHKECAIACAKRGIPLAILEEKTEIVYFTTKDRGNSGANDLLLPFVGERVEVRGRLAEKGGARLLLVRSVERTDTVSQ
jgi:hypothetical protein